MTFFDPRIKLRSADTLGFTERFLLMFILTFFDLSPSLTHGAVDEAQICRYTWDHRELPALAHVEIAFQNPNTHKMSTHLMAHLAELRNNGDNADVTLNCQGEVVKAHSLILGRYV